MKIAGLVIGILLLILSLVGAVVCMMLPSLTNNRINFEEAALGLIPAGLGMIVGFLITVISAFLVIRSRRVAAASPR